MGAHPYFYFVPYQPDTNAALQALRAREFRAGRYNPVIPFLDFPIDANSPSPGAQHASIADAFEDADADGTRSILDLDRIDTEPDFGAVVPLDAAVLEDLYGTSQPSRAMVDENMDFFEDVERGQGIYLLVYKDGQPNEILFAGYSYD
jgi:hypothetical protein